VRLAVFPLFHVSGLSTVVGGVEVGSKSVWLLGRFDPAAAKTTATKAPARRTATKAAAAASS
jgi:hypothetical protein